MPDRITGTVELIVALSDKSGAEPQALADLVSNWVRAAEVGFFGPGRIRRQAVETEGQRVSATLECEEFPRAAFAVLARMVRYFSKMKGKVKDFTVLHESQPLAMTGKTAIPALPESIPFEVEYPEDLKRFVRVEIEFRRPLTPSAQEAIFGALSTWDTVIEGLSDEEWWGQQTDPESQSEYRSRLFGPAIVEHEVDGYFASFECLEFIVWMGLRLHQRLAIERITIE